MENFASSKLNRSFALIYFGALGESAAVGASKLPRGTQTLLGAPIHALRPLREPAPMQQWEIRPPIPTARPAPGRAGASGQD